MKVLIYLMLISLGVSYQCQLQPQYQQYQNQAYKMFEEGITPEMMETIKTIDLPWKCLTKFQNKSHTSNCTESHFYYRTLYAPFFEEFAKDFPEFSVAITLLDNANFYKRKCQIEQSPLKLCNCEQNFTWSTHSYLKRNWAFKVFDKIPVFAPTIIKGCNFDILFPTVYHLKEVFPNQSLNTPWEEKQFKAYWRGSISQIYYMPQTMDISQFSQRLRLIDACRDIPECDVMHVDLFTVPAPLRTRRFNIRYPKSCLTEIQTWSRYKIILDIDGATFSARFPKILQLGSAIFKINTFDDIGTIGAIPWVHYVPVNMDLSDLKEKLEWAKNNDDKLKEIAENGRQFSLRMHNMEAFKCYIYHLLLKYIQLLKKGGAILT